MSENDIENRMRQLIDNLSKEELEVLRNIIKKEYKTSSYVPSGDSKVIASYARRFKYDPARREEVLKRLNLVDDSKGSKKK